MGGTSSRTKTFNIVGDLIAELGLRSTDDDDVEEPNEMYGPPCWRGCDTVRGGFKKLMWNEIMKEVNCKVTSTWLSCGGEREMAFAHRQFRKDGKRKDDAAGLHHRAQEWLRISRTYSG